jgi:hypothetical protein
MTVVVHNAEIDTGTGADPSVYTLGFTPTSGRSLLVAARSFNAPIAGLSDNQSNTWATDFEPTSGDVVFFRCQSIGTAPTTLSLDHDGTVFTYIVVLEVSGLASSPITRTQDEEVITAPDATTHNQDYTTDVDGSLVFGYFEDSGNTEYAGASGTTVLVRDTAEARGGFYKVVTTAETGTIDFTSVDNKGPTATHVVYEPSVGGGGSVVPQARYYYNMQLS